jgi:hypothetical protein
MGTSYNKVLALKIVKILILFANFFGDFIFLEISWSHPLCFEEQGLIIVGLHYQV